MRNNKILTALIVIAVCAAGAFAGYIFLKKSGPGSVSGEKAIVSIPEGEDLMTVSITYPMYTRLHKIEKQIPKRTKPIAIAEAVIEEFFKGFADGKVSFMSSNVKVLGLYKGPDKILHIDLSEEFRNEFQGGALAEYLILSGLYETLAGNLKDFSDFKILIKGQEIESLGGHFLLKYPLKRQLSSGQPPVGPPAS